MESNTEYRRSIDFAYYSNIDTDDARTVQTVDFMRIQITMEFHSPIQTTFDKKKSICHLAPPF